MKKQILTLAILATLPFGVWADELTITNADKQHIASTAYVKGAYNALENQIGMKQERLADMSNDEDISYEVLGFQSLWDILEHGDWDFLKDDSDKSKLATAEAILYGIQSQRATVYTTWDNDNATKQVAFVTATQSGQ